MHATKEVKAGISVAIQILEDVVELVERESARVRCGEAIARGGDEIHEKLQACLCQLKFLDHMAEEFSFPEKTDALIRISIKKFWKK